LKNEQSRHASDGCGDPDLTNCKFVGKHHRLVLRFEQGKRSSPARIAAPIEGARSEQKCDANDQ
jgi:hypothetical protein